jgi:hypothetical protein
MLLCVGLTLTVFGLDVTANITNDTVWTMADSPVNVTPYDFTVEEPWVLTIEPGVEVRITNSFTVRGELQACGTVSNRIIFDAAAPDAQWGSLYFRRDAGTELVSNTLHHIDLRNMDSYIYLSEKSLSMMHCTMYSTGSLSYGFACYVNSNTTAAYGAARLTMVSNIMILTTTRDSSGFNGIVVDGMPCELRYNTLHFCATGQLSEAAAVKCYRSNTPYFRGDITGNEISLEIQHPDVMTASGILVGPNSKVESEISNNTITVRGPRTLYGISKSGTNLIIQNNVSMIATSGTSGGYVYGIYSDAAYGGTRDLLVHNRVDCHTDLGSCYMRGIFMQTGRTRGNRIRMSSTATNGSMYGIEQQYYSGHIENNTLCMEATNHCPVRGICLSTHYSSDADIQVRNNIVYSPGSSNAVGVYKDTGCAAGVTNACNLVYGATTAYFNCLPGPGALSGDPLFPDDTFHIGTNSPALNAGTNLAWMASATDMDGLPRIDDGCVDIGADEYLFIPYGSVTDITNLCWNVISGGVYQLESCSNLMAQSWHSGSTVITSRQATLEFAVSNITECLRCFRLKRML